ncbi:MAG: hypothetical protein ACRDVW_01665, partial [Acidimicrobiales bacterium]
PAATDARWSHALATGWSLKAGKRQTPRVTKVAVASRLQQVQQLLHLPGFQGGFTIIVDRVMYNVFIVSTNEETATRVVQSINIAGIPDRPTSKANRQ